MISRLLGAVVPNVRRAVAALLVVTEAPAVRPPINGLESGATMLKDEASELGGIVFTTTRVNIRERRQELGVRKSLDPQCFGWPVQAVYPMLIDYGQPHPTSPAAAKKFPLKRPPEIFELPISQHLDSPNTAHHPSLLLLPVFSFQQGAQATIFCD